LAQQLGITIADQLIRRMLNSLDMQAAVQRGATDLTTAAEAGHSASSFVPFDARATGVGRHGSIAGVVVYMEKIELSRGFACFGIKTYVDLKQP
jgi:hypothetical protein